MKDTLLLCGGAGYIGSVTAHYLKEQGRRIVVIDNLMTGHLAAVSSEVSFYQADIRDCDLVTSILHHERVTEVLHFSASSLVSESVTDPAKYFHNNLEGTLSLLSAMRRAHVSVLVFSSSAAVYGVPAIIPIPDDLQENPINPYGESKLFIERILARYASAYGIRSVSLRYFNACGALRDGSRGEDHSPETHLIPLIARVGLGLSPAVSVFGTDYPTRDGTAVRDYIHVLDLAEAHSRALDYCSRHDGARHFNLGNGEGFTVREIIHAFEQHIGRQIPVIETARRPGDPPVLVADANLAREELGWSPRCTTLDEMIASAWEWHRKNPHGYSPKTG